MHCSWCSFFRTSLKDMPNRFQVLMKGHCSLVWSSKDRWHNWCSTLVSSEEVCKGTENCFYTSKTTRGKMAHASVLLYDTNTQRMASVIYTVAFWRTLQMKFYQRLNGNIYSLGLISWSELLQTWCIFPDWRHWPNLNAIFH